MFDILIKNGTIVDGTRAKRFVADIGVKDGKIAKIGTNLPGEAGKIIDATGLIVTPGFIDSHTHSDRAFLLGTDSYNFLEQGVTTEIAGQCGSSCVPYYEGLNLPTKTEPGSPEYQELFAACDNYHAFMEHARKQKIGTNLAFYAGQGAIRGRVMGFSPERPTAEELAEQKKWVAQAMEAGYLGITTGFVYAPSVYADEAETVELCKTVAEYGGSYSSHIRDEADDVVEAVQEAINIAEKAKVPTVISHLKVTGVHNEGLSTTLLKMIDDANDKGLKVLADQYPYTAGSAPFISTIPAQCHTVGPKQLVENLKSPEYRKELVKLIRSIPTSSYNLAGFDAFLIVDSSKTPQYVGKNLQQIADEEGKDPFDVAFDLLVDNDGVVQMVYFTQNQSDMDRILAHPRVMAGADWSDYPQHFDREKVGGGHPRGTATMIRHLELVRDRGLFTLEDAIARITSMPADMYMIDGIGYLKEGYNADIAIFDYAALKAHADFIHPFRKNDGVHYVMVNGQLVVEDGLVNGTRAGKIHTKRK